MNDGLLFVLIFGGGLLLGCVVLWFGIFRPLFEEQRQRHYEMFKGTKFEEKYKR